LQDMKEFYGKRLKVLVETKRGAGGFGHTGKE
jgi:dUTPase